MLEQFLEDGVPGAPRTFTALENRAPWVCHGFASFTEDLKAGALLMPSDVAGLGSVSIIKPGEHLENSLLPLLWGLRLSENLHRRCV